MADEAMFLEAVSAARQGQRRRAQDLLTRLIRGDEQRADYWLWLSAVVDTPREQAYCLENALRLEPENQSALRGLVLMGRLPAGENVLPVPPARRSWAVNELTIPALRGLKALLARPVLAGSLLGVLILILLALGTAGLFRLLGRSSSARLLAPPAAATLTPLISSSLQASAPAAESPDASVGLNQTAPASTFLAQPAPANTPVSGVLPAVTPQLVELYMQTPHPANEAYRLGLRRLSTGDWAGAVDSFKQAAPLDPQSPDILYYLGEAYRGKGDPRNALAAYQRALKIDPGFAPAYLGIAHSRRALNPDYQMSSDLDKALELDPSYGEAYLARAALRLEAGETVEARADLADAARLLPGSFQVYLLQSQASLLARDASAALEQARRAIELAPQAPQARFALAQAALAALHPAEALSAAQAGARLAPQDANGLSLLGQAFFASGQYTQALQAAGQALEIQSNLPQAHLVRGLSRLELGDETGVLQDLRYASQRLPASFDASLGLGRALLASGQLADARQQVSQSQELAASDAELAQVYYWRARILETIGNPRTAAEDWQALLDLPASASPQSWRQEAQGRLSPTPTP